MNCFYAVFQDAPGTWFSAAIIAAGEAEALATRLGGGCMMGIMSNQEGSACAVQTLERVDDFAFVFAVQAGHGLIENKDRRLATSGAGNGHALSLTSA